MCSVVCLCIFSNEKIYNIKYHINTLLLSAEQIIIKKKIRFRFHLKFKIEKINKYV